MKKTKIGVMVASALFATAMCGSAFAKVECELEQTTAFDWDEKHLIFLHGDHLQHKKHSYVKVEICGRKAYGHVKVGYDGEFYGVVKLPDGYWPLYNDANTLCNVEVEQKLSKYSNTKIECNAGSLIPATSLSAIPGAAAGADPQGQYDSIVSDLELETETDDAPDAAAAPDAPDAPVAPAAKK
jgi:hypothetical protein